MIKAAIACIATFIAGLSVGAAAVSTGEPGVSALSAVPSSSAPATDVQVVTRTVSVPTTVTSAPRTQVQERVVPFLVAPKTITRTATATATAKPKTVMQVSYSSCAEVRAAGKAPINKGQPGYSSELDRDEDGTACE